MQERLPWIISTPTFLIWSSPPADNCTKQVSYLRNAGRVPTVIPLENHWDPLLFFKWLALQNEGKWLHPSSGVFSDLLDSIEQFHMNEKSFTVIRVIADEKTTGCHVKSRTIADGLWRCFNHSRLER